jgi:predicted TIM-barrel fold metal-dependent hydrolase
MLTRRELIQALAASALSAEQIRAIAPVTFDVPKDACDCHTHIVGDSLRFPLFAGRTYTPELALPGEMSALHRTLHIKRVVIVTPSIYGTDNSATLYGMKARGRNARGIAVIDEKTPDKDLDAMAAAGICGIRLNLATGGSAAPEVARLRFTAAAKRVKSRNWHIQMYATLPVISAIKDIVAGSTVPVVFDHFAGAQAALGLDQPGFADLIELLHSGRAYVKISGAYRASKLAPEYPDVAPFARALIAANRDRVLWGSDWPHPNTSPADHQPTDVTPRLPIDDGLLFNQLPVWAPDPLIRRKILVDNPQRLYRF